MGAFPVGALFLFTLPYVRMAKWKDFSVWSVLLLIDIKEEPLPCPKGYVEFRSDFLRADLRPDMDFMRFKSGDD